MHQLQRPYLVDLPHLCWPNLRSMRYSWYFWMSSSFRHEICRWLLMVCKVSTCSPDQWRPPLSFSSSPFSFPSFDAPVVVKARGKGHHSPPAMSSPKSFCSRSMTSIFTSSPTKVLNWVASKTLWAAPVVLCLDRRATSLGS